MRGQPRLLLKIVQYVGERGQMQQCEIAVLVRLPELILKELGRFQDLSIRPLQEHEIGNGHLNWLSRSEPLRHHGGAVRSAGEPHLNQERRRWNQKADDPGDRDTPVSSITAGGSELMNGEQGQGREQACERVLEQHADGRRSADNHPAANRHAVFVEHGDGLPNDDQEYRNRHGVPRVDNRMHDSEWHERSKEHCRPPDRATGDDSSDEAVEKPEKRDVDNKQDESGAFEDEPLREHGSDEVAERVDARWIRVRIGEPGRKGAENRVVVTEVLAAVAVLRDAKEAWDQAGQEGEPQKDPVRRGVGRLVMNRGHAYRPLDNWPLVIWSARAMLERQLSPKSRIR